MKRILGICFIGFALPTAMIAQQSGPLSAVDWLSDSVVLNPDNSGLTPPIEAPITETANAPTVAVTALDAPTPDRTGLFDAAMTGLPQNLWSTSSTADIVPLVAAQPISGLPAAQDLLRLLILTEAEPPFDANAKGQLFLARVDKLLDIGAVEPAMALLSAVPEKSPEVFQRWFDVSLLTGDEARACETISASDALTPNYPTRVFCFARNGDWANAALSLSTRRAVGDISEDEAHLLERFLDPALFDGEPPLPRPARITPLKFRLHQAIGEGIATQTLPQAFAHADLSDTAGWKNQLEAAERLARTGAIPIDILYDLYLSRRPAASGGVWDRARAIQALDKALGAQDETAVEAALPAAWAAMQTTQTEVAFAGIFGNKLAAMDLSATAAETAHDIALLSSDYETLAFDGEDAAFVDQIAWGDPQNPQTDLEHAIFTGFRTDTENELTELARNGKLGEALLQSIASIQTTAASDLQTVTEVLSFWRSVGLEDTARRAALQLLILNRFK